MTERLERLRAELDRIGAGTLLVTQPTNVRYLCGFESSNAALLITRSRALLLTDGRYIGAARALAGMETVQLERELALDLGQRLGELAESPVAFEADHLTVAQHLSLGAACLELLPTCRVVQGLRAVKDGAELESIRKAAAVLDRVLQRFVAEPVVGRSEAELAWWVRCSLREEGAQDVSFDPIVASGPNSALPHHHPGERRVARDELLLVDLGARVDGYCSDCTRTFATGGLSDELEQAYATCLEAQTRSLAAVRPGATGAELDSLARGIVESAGTPVLHGLGHGVGLDIHELPVLRKGVEAKLEVGQVVTVEPGVYLEGQGGVRIEDLVVVTEGEPELLSPFPKTLIRLYE